MLLACYTIGHCLDAKYRAIKREKMNIAEYRRTFTRGPATTCVGFRASEWQRKVRKLIASAVWLIAV